MFPDSGSSGGDARSSAADGRKIVRAREALPSDKNTTAPLTSTGGCLGQWGARHEGRQLIGWGDDRKRSGPIRPDAERECVCVCKWTLCGPGCPSLVAGSRTWADWMLCVVTRVSGGRSPGTSETSPPRLHNSFGSYSAYIKLERV